jgi:hypothetical protein
MNTEQEKVIKLLMRGESPEDLKDDFGSEVVEEAIAKLEERI